MMNAFVESLIQQREKEYRREIGLEIRSGDLSERVSSSLSEELDDPYFTNIQVRVLDDNPKSMISTKRALPTPISDKEQDSPPNPAEDKERTTRSSQPNIPPPPPKLPSEQSYSPMMQSKRERKGNKREMKKSLSESNVQRWGGSIDDTSPTTMPKCPKRSSLSPTRSPESLDGRHSLVSMATKIVSSSVGTVDSTYTGGGRVPK